VSRRGFNPISNFDRRTRSSFWRELSNRLGDRHATRICILLNWYFTLANLDPARLHIPITGKSSCQNSSRC
jgi:hypothetical protein